MLEYKTVNKNLKALNKFFKNIVSPNYQNPSIDGLSDSPADEIQREIAFQPPIDFKTVENILNQYKIKAKFSDMLIGPSVTTYLLEPSIGTKTQNILRYQNDIARDMGLPSVRVLPIVEGTSMIGIEIPHKEKFSVSYKNMVSSIPNDIKLPIIMGEDTYGNKIYEDLTNMPHLLVAGRTGSGKSVFINNLITTLLIKKSPDEVKLLLVDPKQVEFISYSGVSHLMEDIANDIEESKELLNKAVEEMERRFDLLMKAKVKKIYEYNKVNKTKLPYIVLVIDEFAELMMMGKPIEKEDVERKIVRLAQKARAVGIHMVLATQKPLVAVMTSLIKANMPARIAFTVNTYMDSKVILDDIGAENLTGNGDMLFRSPYSNNMKRIQSPYINDADIDYITNQIK